MNARQCADAIATAMTARDLDGLLTVYADDVVFNSPVTAVQFRGKEEVAELLTHVLSGFETWEQTFVLADEHQCVFGARGRIGGRDVELAELIRVDSDGRIAEIVIHGRPPGGSRRHRRSRRASSRRSPRPDPGSARPAPLARTSRCAGIR
jgi:SnoaL-like domain